MRPVSVLNAEEVSTIQSSTAPDEIVAIYQAMDDKNLLVVHQSGLFHRWDFRTQTIEAEYNFLAGSRFGVNFSANGDQVITPGKLLSSDLLYGHSLWDVKTGELLECRGDHCPDPESFSEQFAKNGIALSPNGKWIIECRGIGLSYDTLFREVRLGGGGSVDPDDFDQRYYTIDQITVDISGVYLACAIQEGIIRIYDIDYQFLPKSEEKPLDDYDYPLNDYDVEYVRRLERKYGRYDSEHPIQTADLVIDDTRTWLARLTDEDLIIYDLRKMIFPQHMKVPITDGNLLAFNHSGNLLVVATDEGILMFDPASKEQVASFKAGEATALFFTHDDRLLTWGDKDSVIHIWGVKRGEE